MGFIYWDLNTFSPFKYGSKMAYLGLVQLRNSNRLLAHLSSNYPRLVLYCMHSTQLYSHFGSSMANVILLLMVLFIVILCSAMIILTLTILSFFHLMYSHMTCHNYILLARPCSMPNIFSSGFFLWNTEKRSCICFMSAASSFFQLFHHIWQVQSKIQFIKCEFILKSQLQYCLLGSMI